MTAPSRTTRAAWAPTLLDWYRRTRRDLPWRATRDPYRIWVSEVMLQQTQVATALPYYSRFVERFPTVAALADAPLDDVLHAWAGLGYYRRARQLHQAANVVVREHDARVPDDPEAFGRLPGVGRYTRGAVLSIGFDRPLAVLDGNVARVLSRLEGIPASIRDPRGARTLWDRATALVPMHGAGDWNQALMELGAVVCTPRVPHCGECPVREKCRALATGRVDRLPPVTPRRATERVLTAALLARRGGKLLMVRRTGGLLDGLWEPPTVPLEERRSPARRMLAVLEAAGLSGTLRPTGVLVRHTITHRRYEVAVWAAERVRRVARTTATASASARWVDPACPDVPITGLARKLARVAG